MFENFCFSLLFFSLHPSLFLIQAHVFPLQVAQEIGTEVKYQKDFLEQLVHYTLDNLYLIFAMCVCECILELKSSCDISTFSCGNEEYILPKVVSSMNLAKIYSL